MCCDKAENGWGRIPGRCASGHFGTNSNAHWNKLFTTQELHMRDGPHCSGIYWI